MLKVKSYYKYSYMSASFSEYIDEIFLEYITDASTLDAKRYTFMIHLFKNIN